MSTGKILLDLHRPPNRNSKANLSFDALAEVYETNDIKELRIGEGIQVFWGLANGNSHKIKLCEEQNLPWLFVDMPYWLRWTKKDLNWSMKAAQWRFIPNAFHPTYITEFSNNRLSNLTNTPMENKTDGDTILICPSSVTLTKHITGKTDLEWVEDTIKKVKKLFPKKQIKVRHKPRDGRTSGPDAALIPIEADLEGVHHVITLASICSVDAFMKGYSVQYTHEGVNPSQPISSILSKEIKYVSIQERAAWANVLANHQFSLNEVRQNKLDGLIERCFMRM